MKIVNKNLEKTADVSSAKGTTAEEFWKMVLSAVILLITLYFLTGLIVDFAVSKISFETEAKIFGHFQFPEREKEDSKKPDSLKEAEAILKTLSADEKVPPLPYRLVLIEHEQPNAFAFPGGTIGVTTSLLEVLTDKIQIAFVIGHELGHFYNRDHLRGLGRATGYTIIMAILFGTGSGAESFGNMVNLVIQRDYSQGREKAADRFGLELVYSAYGKVDGTDHLFKILHEQNKLPKWAYMFSTHPSPEQRIDKLTEYARELEETS